MGKAHFRVYADLNESLRTGKPAGEKTVGMPVFEYVGKNPEYSEVFNRAMTNLSAAVIPAALEAYDFSAINAPDFGKVMDIEMLALPGGRERTKEEFRALFNSAGFELKSLTPTKSPVFVIEAQKI